MPVLCKKLQEDYRRGQISQESVKSLPPIEEITNNLQNLGLERVKPIDYHKSYSSEINEAIINLQNDQRPFAKVSIVGNSIIALLDSGAHLSILGIGALKLLKRCGLQLFPSEVSLKTANGEKLNVHGVAYLPITFENKTKIIEALVVPTLKRRMLLGINFWNAFEIRPTIHETKVEELQTFADYENYSEDTIQNATGEMRLTPEQRVVLEQTKIQFKTAGEGVLDTTGWINHRIELTEEARKLPPVRLNPFPTSPKRQEQINQELNRMLECRIIEKSYSDWALRLVPVDKPDGTVRLCLDARKLNERTVRDCYPLPHADRILSRLGAAEYISTIDLSKAFLQVPLHPKSRKYTAFSVLGQGLFQFTRMPFGLVNSPATLSRLMDRVLGGGELEPKVFVYLDDIIVISDTFEEHISLLQQVADRLKAANLSINIEKSRFCVSEVPYLGYILGRDGLRPNPDRISAIVNYERPKSLKALRRFLGMCNYYRRFLAEYSAVTQPLTNLLRNKPKNIQWNDKAESAFTEIKERLITAPILANPDFTLPFAIHCDASDIAIAGVLTQTRDGTENPIAYFSQKLSPTQQRYCATEKEGLAVLKSVEKFRCYVERTKFTVYTDASALAYIIKSSWRTSSRLCRWSIELQGHDMLIVHKKGADNLVADALSRAVEELETVSDKVGWYARQLKNVQDNPEKYKDFQIQKGILKKLTSTPDDVLDYRFAWKTCVPESSREKVLVEEHDDRMHLGREKTLSMIRKKYFWPKMAEDVANYIRKCSVCLQAKPANRSQLPEAGNQRITYKPFQIIALDFIQSLPRSKEGHAHLLVISDLFSKWCLLIPVKRITVSQVVKILEQSWFRRYSVPEFIITDNASTFLSREFRELLAKYQIRHWTNPRHHSQSNPVERLNRTINACIRTYVKDNQKLWDTRVSEIEFCLNNTPHSATGFSPYRVLFGHDVVETGEEHRIDRDKECLSDGERIERKGQIDKRIYSLVAKNLKKSHEKGIRAYNLRSNNHAPVYVVGQRVLRRNFRQSAAGVSYNAKLDSLYVPCVILARVGTSAYELANEQGKPIGVFSVTDLKPIH